MLKLLEKRDPQSKPNGSLCLDGFLFVVFVKNLMIACIAIVDGLESSKIAFLLRLSSMPELSGR